MKFNFTPLKPPIACIASILMLAAAFTYLLLAHHETGKLLEEWSATESALKPYLKSGAGHRMRGSDCLAKLSELELRGDERARLMKMSLPQGSSLFPLLKKRLDTDSERRLPLLLTEAHPIGAFLEREISLKESIEIERQDLVELLELLSKTREVSVQSLTLKRDGEKTWLNFLLRERVHETTL